MLIIIISFALFRFDVFAHEFLLNISYDECNADDEIWYYLNEENYSKTKPYEYLHISESITTIKYYIEDEAIDGPSVSWDFCAGSQVNANEIKTAFVKSMEKWNNVYYYSYDKGNSITHKIINIEETKSKEEANLIIYPVMYIPKSNVDDGITYYANIRPIVSQNDIVEYYSNVDTQSHYDNWRINVNVLMFYEHSEIQFIPKVTKEEAEVVRKRSGGHEIGHLLGLDDIDECCETCDEDHHEEVLMGYGNILNRQTEIIYQDIAGVSITRGFHTDNDHIWMKRVNEDSTIDVICALCNGIRKNQTIENNLYEGKELNYFKECCYYDDSIL